MTKRIISGLFILVALGVLGLILAGALNSGEQLVVRFLTAVIVAGLSLYLISDLRIQADEEAEAARQRQRRRAVTTRPGTPESPTPNGTVAYMATVTGKRTGSHNVVGAADPPRAEPPVDPPVDLTKDTAPVPAVGVAPTIFNDDIPPEDDDIPPEPDWPHAPEVETAIQSGLLKTVSKLMSDGRLSAQGPITDRDVRTMVYVAFTAGELRKILLAGGTIDGDNSGLDLGDVELLPNPEPESAVSVPEPEPEPTVEPEVEQEREPEREGPEFLADLRPVGAADVAGAPTPGRRPGSPSSSRCRPAAPSATPALAHR